MKRFLAVAAVLLALAPLGAEAQSSRWTYDGYGRPAAETCFDRGRGAVCARIVCADGRLMVEMLGLRPGYSGDVAPGAVVVDGYAQPVEWFYYETRGGGSRWIADIGRTRGLIDDIQLGQVMEIDFAQRRRPLVFSLDGSYAAIDRVRSACR